MFYHRCLEDIRVEVEKVQNTNHYSNSYRQYLQLQKAKEELQQRIVSQVQSIDHRETQEAKKLIDLTSQQQSIVELLKELQLKRLVGFAQRCPEIKTGAIFMISHYCRGFMEQRKYEKILKFHTRRMMTYIQSRINRRRILNKTNKETKLIICLQKQMYQGCYVLAVVKKREKDSKKAQISVFPIVSNKKFPAKGLKTTIPLETLNAINIFENLYFDPSRGILTSLNEYLDHRHELLLKIVSIVSRLKSKHKFRKLRYAAKRLISDIYEAEISKIPLRIWFWITVDGQKLQIESITQGFSVLIEKNIPLNVEPSSFLRQLFQKYIISHKENRLIRRVDYDQARPSVIRIQAIYRSHRLSKKYQAARPHGPVRLVTNSQRTIFLSVIINQHNLTMYFESYCKAPLSHHFQLRHQHIVKQCLAEIGSGCVQLLNQAMFQRLIVQIKLKIAQYQDIQQKIFFSQPPQFFRRLRKFLFKLKLRVSIRKKQLAVMKIPMGDHMLLMLKQQAAITKGFYEIYFYHLGIVFKPISFLINRLCFPQDATLLDIRQHFYLSDKFCCISPVQKPTCRYFQWMSELRDGDILLLYNIFLDNRQFFIESFIPQNTELVLVECREISKKEMMDMNKIDIEEFVMNCYLNKNKTMKI